MEIISRFQLPENLMTLASVLRCKILVHPTARVRKGREYSSPTWDGYSSVSSWVSVAVRYLGKLKKVKINIKYLELPETGAFLPYFKKIEV